MAKTLADRSIFISTQPGRQVLGHIPGLKATIARSVETDTWTHVWVGECPLPTGPMPAAWPQKAKVPVPVPRNAPRLPLPGIKRTPDSVRYASSEDETFYSVTWFIHEPKATAYPRWIEALRKTAKWKIERNSNGTFCYAKDKRRSIEIQFLTYENPNIPLPSDWCLVSMEWNVK